MTAPLVERSTGDLINVEDHNDILPYIENGTYRVNTLSLQIQGTEIITEDGYVTPIRVQAPDSDGILFYNSSGVLIAKFDDDGNFHLKGRSIKL